MRASIIEYRNLDDFTYGSLKVIIRKDEILLTGLLKKSGAHSKYMLIRRK